MTTDDSHADPATATAGDDQVGALASSITMLTIGAGRQVQSLLDDELARLGLSMRHLGALGHLAANPDLSISDLARRSGVTAQSMHATVHGLQERGALRARSEGRGRAARLVVTSGGRTLLQDARAAIARLDATLLERLGTEGAHRLQESLRVLAPAPPRPR